MKIQYREFTRPSACEEGEVFSRSWQPDAAPRAIIQIAHGMQEHAGRYDRFARRLAENGWAVYANDHIGHGKSAMGHMGTFSMMPGGFEFLLADMHTLFAYARDEHPDLPCALLGHSMGSIASGIFPARYDDAEILILMGTPAPNALAGFGAVLAGAAARLKGPTAQSPLITRLADANTGAGSSRDPMERNAWLSRDENEVRRAIADPLFGNPFSASAYRELFRALREFGSRKWAGSVKNMPILITAGAADPCGRCGVGPKHYAEALRSSGHTDVTLKLYDGARHELLNELNHTEVEDMLIAFLAQKLESLSAGRNENGHAQ